MIRVIDRHDEWVVEKVQAGEMPALDARVYLRTSAQARALLEFSDPVEPIVPETDPEPEPAPVEPPPVEPARAAGIPEGAILDVSGDN